MKLPRGKNEKEKEILIFYKQIEGFGFFPDNDTKKSKMNITNMEFQDGPVSCAAAAFRELGIFYRNENSSTRFYLCFSSRISGDICGHVLASADRNRCSCCSLLVLSMLTFSLSAESPTDSFLISSALAHFCARRRFPTSCRCAEAAELMQRNTPSCCRDSPAPWCHRCKATCPDRVLELR